MLFTASISTVELHTCFTLMHVQNNLFIYLQTFSIGFLCLKHLISKSTEMTGNAPPGKKKNSVPFVPIIRDLGKWWMTSATGGCACDLKYTALQIAPEQFAIDVKEIIQNRIQ